MKKIITAIAMFVSICGIAQNYTIEQRIWYDVKQDGEVIKTFTLLEDAQTYVESLLVDNNTYTLHPDDWGIVQGVVSDQVALNNRINLNEAILYASEHNYKVFEFGELNVYLQVRAEAFGNTAHRQAVQLWSNTHYKMSDATHLRIQPHELPAGAILSARKQTNIKITGGNLYGDKFEHTYTQGIPYKMHDSGYGVYFRGVRNSVVDGVKMKNFTGDGFNCHGIGRRNADGSVPAGMEDSFCDNLVIKNCTFEANRRNNLSIVDGTNIIIENNLFLKAGELAPGFDTPQGTSVTNYSWTGTIPANGIDLEPRRQANDDEGFDTQFIDNIIIRNNTFRNGVLADVNLRTASNVKIYDNNFDNGVWNLASHDVVIRNNNFKNNPKNTKQVAITINSFIRPGTGEDENVNHYVYDNLIDGYETAMLIGGTNGEYYRNKIKNYRYGITLKTGENNLVFENSMSNPSSNSSRGINLKSKAYLKNVLIKNQTVKGSQYGAYLRQVQGEDEGLILDNVVFEGVYRDLYIQGSDNITVRNSNYQTYKATRSSDIKLENNN